MSLDTFTIILVKKFLGKEFVPRFARYLIIFPDYMVWYGSITDCSIRVFCVNVYSSCN